MPLLSVPLFDVSRPRTTDAKDICDVLGLHPAVVDKKDSVSEILRHWSWHPCSDPAPSLSRRQHCTSVTKSATLTIAERATP